MERNVEKCIEWKSKELQSSAEEKLYETLGQLLALKVDRPQSLFKKSHSQAGLAT